jgi:hypothetical protein
VSYDLDTVARETNAALERIEALRVAVEKIAASENWSERAKAIHDMHMEFVVSVKEHDLPQDPSRHLVPKKD